MKILIVEDEEGSRIVIKLVTKELYIAGANFHEVGSMKEALDYLKKEKPQIMLLDLRLPDSPAHATVDKISDFAEKGISVVVLTGYASEENATKAYAKGAVKVMNKEDAFKEKVLLTSLIEVYQKRNDKNAEILEGLSQWMSSKTL